MWQPSTNIQQKEERKRKWSTTAMAEQSCGRPENILEKLRENILLLTCGVEAGEEEEVS